MLQKNFITVDDVAVDTCNNKVVYYSNKEVDRASRRMLSRFGLKLYPYPCDVCGNIHLTKRVKGKRKTKQKDMDSIREGINTQIKDANMRIMDLEIAVKAAKQCGDKVAVSKFTISMEQTRLSRYDLEDKKQELQELGKHL